MLEHDNRLSAGQTLVAMERLVGGEAIAQERPDNGRHRRVAGSLEPQLDQSESAGGLGEESLDHVRRVLLHGAGAGIAGSDLFETGRIGSQSLEHTLGNLDSQICPRREVVGSCATRLAGLVVDTAERERPRAVAAEAFDGRVQQQDPTGRIRRHGP